MTGRGEGTDVEAGARPPARAGLCPGCLHVQTVTSGKGSTFLLCRLSRADPRYPKYPPQPVAFCPGHEKLPSPT